MSQYKLVRFNLNGKDVEKMVDVRASLTDICLLYTSPSPRDS